MKFESAVLGMIEYEPQDTITFANGLPGFESHQHFLLCPLTDHEPFALLQSLHNSEIAFAVVNPLLIRPDYHPQIPDQELQALGLNDVNDALMVVTVVLASEPAKMTVNLKGPILINLHTRTGCQIALSGQEYLTKHYILQEMSAVQSQGE